MSEKSPKGVRVGSAQGDLLLSIVYSLYRTIREEDRWPTILQQIQELLSAQTCSLCIHDFGVKAGSIAIHSGCFDEQHIALYRDIYSALDPWLAREEHHRIVETSWVGEELVPHEQLLTTQFYREWLRPQGLMHQCSGILFRDEGQMVHLVSHRSGKSGVFNRSTLYPLQRLLPHIRQTLELQEMFARFSSRASHPLGDIVRQLGSTMLIVDAERRLLAASAQAEEMLDAGGPITIGQGQISARSDELTAKLRRLVDEAFRTAEGEGLSAGGSLALPEGGNGSTTVGVGPLLPDTLPGQTRPAVYVTINDKPLPDRMAGTPPRRWLPLLLRTSDEDRGPLRDAEPLPGQPNSIPDSSETNDERLRRLYNLTRSESRLAELLASGLGLPSAAAHLRVGLNTIRTHLQHIYSKTDTHHQSELVALLLTGPARLDVEYHIASSGDPWRDTDDDSGRLVHAVSEPTASAQRLRAGMMQQALVKQTAAEKAPRSR